MSNFRQLLTSLPEEIENKLNEKNITSPTKVQEMVIPLLFQKKDILFESATGTGKTLAYLLPLFTILENERNAVKKESQLLVDVAEKPLVVEKKKRVIKKRKEKVAHKTEE